MKKIEKKEKLSTRSSSLELQIRELEAAIPPGKDCPVTCRSGYSIRNYYCSYT